MAALSPKAQTQVVLPFLAIGRVHGGVPLAACCTGKVKANRDKHTDIFKRLLTAAEQKLKAGQRIRLEANGGNVHCLMDAEGVLMSCVMTSQTKFPEQHAYDLLMEFIQQTHSLCDGELPTAGENSLGDILDPVMRELISRYGGSGSTLNSPATSPRLKADCNLGLVALGRVSDGKLMSVVYKSGGKLETQMEATEEELKKGIERARQKLKPGQMAKVAWPGTTDSLWCLLEKENGAALCMAHCNADYPEKIMHRLLQDLAEATRSAPGRGEAQAKLLEKLGLTLQRFEDPTKFEFLPYLGVARARDFVVLVSCGEADAKTKQRVEDDFKKLLASSRDKMLPGKMQRLKWSGGMLCCLLDMESQFVACTLTTFATYPECMSYDVLHTAVTWVKSSGEAGKAVEHGLDPILGQPLAEMLSKHEGMAVLERHLADSELNIASGTQCVVTVATPILDPGSLAVVGEVQPGQLVAARGEVIVGGDNAGRMVPIQPKGAVEAEAIIRAPPASPPKPALGQGPTSPKGKVGAPLSPQASSFVSRSFGGDGPMPCPSMMKGHMTKKSPGLLRMHLKDQKRYVMLHQGRFMWSQAEGVDWKGIMDFKDFDGKAEWKAEPQGATVLTITGGAAAKDLIFDCKDSEYTRDVWIQAIAQHIAYGIASRVQGQAALPPASRNSMHALMDHGPAIEVTSIVASLQGVEGKNFKLQCGSIVPRGDEVEVVLMASDVYSNIQGLQAMVQEELFIILRKTPPKSVGITKSKDCLVVNSDVGTLISQWNEENPTMQVQEGDKVLEINGVTEVAGMVNEIKNNDVLRLRISPTVDPSKPPRTPTGDAAAKAQIAALQKDLAASRKRIAELDELARSRDDSEELTAAKARIEELEAAGEGSGRGRGRVCSDGAEAEDELTFSKARILELEGLLRKSDLGEALAVAQQRISELEDESAGWAHLEGDLKAARARISQLEAGASGSAAQAAEQLQVAHARIKELESGLGPTDLVEDLAAARERIRELESAPPATVTVAAPPVEDTGLKQALATATARVETLEKEIRIMRSKLAEAAGPSPEEVALKKLRAAIAASAGAEELQALVDDARAVGVEGGEELDEAEGLIRAMQAAQSLQEAVEAMDLDRLREALAAAEAANVAGALLDSAREVLAAEERRLEEMGRKEKKGLAEEILKQAVAQRNVEKLRTAIAQAIEAEVDQGKIREAEETLRQEEAKEEARAALRALHGTEDIGALAAAVAKAKQAGLPAAEVAEPASRLAFLERRRDAEAHLRAAAEGADVEALRASIEEAQAAGVDEAHIGHAQAALAKLEALAKARGLLEEACAKCTKEALREAIQMAREANLEPEAIVKAEELLRREEEKERLMAAVTEAMEESKKIDLTSIDAVREAKEKISEAIAAATAMGVPEADLMDAELRRKKLHNTIEDLKGSIRVFCRIRPLSGKETHQGDHSITKQTDPMTLEVEDEEGGKTHTFNFDAVFTPGTQEQIFEDCRDLVQSAVDGYNVTLFAYGQTGAGKTFTMAGIPGNEGVSPRTIKEIFGVIEKGKKRFDYTVMGSMLELHRQDLVDLLAKGDTTKKTRPKPLNVRTDAKGTVIIENLTEEVCSNPEELEDLLARGNEQRSVAATEMNSESSRSHLVLIIRITSINKETNETLRGKILIVDLAGSERLKKSQTTADMQKESIEINKSLTALGDVIEALTKNQKQIPYRNHKLTQLMQDSLGGTAKTLMFVNCSPAHSNTEETVQSLKYAARAKKITNTTAKNG